MRCFLAGVVAVLTLAPMAALAQAAPSAGPLKAGFAEADITPALVAGKPVYLAGYGMNRKATGVHDPIMARCVVLESGGERIALACVDLIGLQYPQVKEIRSRLADFRYVMVSSTHNHEGPDVIGIWGRGPFHRGVDDSYLTLVVERVVAMIQEAAGKLAPVTAAFGTAEDESLVNDSRLPIVKDGVLRVVRLNQAGTAMPAGLIIDWSSHPEALGSKNKLLTADFPHATVAALKKRYQCPVLYLSGAVGGLLAPPRGNVKDAAGNVLHEGDFEYARIYGEMVADLAAKAIDSAEPLALAPFVISARPIAVPVENSLYRVARAIGVLKRPATVWTGDFQQFGDPMTLEKKSLPFGGRKRSRLSATGRTARGVHSRRNLSRAGLWQDSGAGRTGRGFCRRTAGALGGVADARQKVAADRPGKRRGGLHSSQAAVGQGPAVCLWQRGGPIWRDQQLRSAGRADRDGGAEAAGGGGGENGSDAIARDGLSSGRIANCKVNIANRKLDCGVGTWQFAFINLQFAIVPHQHPFGRSSAAQGPRPAVRTYPNHPCPASVT